ncbi:MAG: glycoside hydrolase family 3 C-terminal domain-containing protein [Bacteroidota bacterium]
MLGEYHAGIGLGGPAWIRVDGNVDFNWWEDAPHPSISPDSFSVRWTGVLVPPFTGIYDLGARVFGQFRLWLEDTLLTEYSDRHAVFTQTVPVQLRAGRPYRIRLEFHDRRSDALVQLVWSVPNDRLREEAIECAKNADVAVVVLGLTPRLEGEEMPVKVEGFAGGDRTSLDLPRQQEELLKAIVATGTPVVLVLMNGSALAINWASENVPAIVEAWYPGQAAGTAVADVLFGDVNPSGRLPVTAYRSVAQLPPFSDYAMKGRTYRYFSGEPLYPFGYGLSYTRFRYSDLRLPANVETGHDIVVSAAVENAGSMQGEEVAQLYVTLEGASAPVPIRSLQGFQRVALSPGESARVTFTLTPRQISLIDDAGVRIQLAGSVRISIGGEQPGMVGRQDAPTTETVTATMTVTGRQFVIKER